MHALFRDVHGLHEDLAAVLGDGGCRGGGVVRAQVGGPHVRHPGHGVILLHDSGHGLAVFPGRDVAAVFLLVARLEVPPKQFSVELLGLGGVRSHEVDPAGCAGGDVRAGHSGSCRYPRQQGRGQGMVCEDKPDTMPEHRHFQWSRSKLSLNRKMPRVLMVQDPGHRSRKVRDSNSWYGVTAHWFSRPAPSAARTTFLTE